MSEIHVQSPRYSNQHEDIESENVRLESTGYGRGKKRGSKGMRRAKWTGSNVVVVMAVSAALVSGAAAQQCISLNGSTMCSAFQGAQISTSDALKSNLWVSMVVCG